MKLINLIVESAIKVAVICAASTKHLHQKRRPQTWGQTQKRAADQFGICSNDDIPPPLVPAVVVLTFLTLCKEETQRRSLSIYNRPWTFYWHNTQRAHTSRSEVRRRRRRSIFSQAQIVGGGQNICSALARSHVWIIISISLFPCSLRVWAN